MTIHPDQKNVELLCEHAHFVDSGFQSFHEQVRHLTQQQMSEAAFYAGAALTLKLTDYFKESAHTDEQTEFLIDMIYLEVSEFMDKNRMRLEWEPHVPKAWQQ